MYMILLVRLKLIALKHFNVHLSKKNANSVTHDTKKDLNLYEMLLFAILTSCMLHMYVFCDSHGLKGRRWLADFPFIKFRIYRNK